jgi:hypothetical protein
MTYGRISCYCRPQSCPNTMWIEVIFRLISYSGLLFVCQENEIQVTRCLPKTIHWWSKWHNCYLWKQSTESKLNLPCCQETKPRTQVIQWSSLMKNQYLIWKLKMSVILYFLHQLQEKTLINMQMRSEYKLKKKCMAVHRLELIQKQISECFV